MLPQPFQAAHFLPINILRNLIVFCICWGGILETAAAETAAVKSTKVDSGAVDRPNIIIVLTDNQGAWTLGCYGNPEIRTPAIDQLARRGTLFTHAYASNPVCSPTRATLLTGLLPSQHGVHSFLVGNRLQVGPEARNTLAEFVSLPELLKAEGYRCGLVGKWHLGDNLHPQEGLDDYWITMPHGGTSTFYGAPVIENGQIRSEPEYLTDFWTKHALRFLDQSRQFHQPFFLLLAYNGPYSLGRLLLEPGQNRHAEFYSQQELTSFPRQKIHPWQLNNRDYHNNPVSAARVATEVSGIDDGVGTIIDYLDEHQLREQTLVIYLADQGWVGGQQGFFGMGDHTRPVTSREGMMQIPLIFSQPGQIRENQQIAEVIANYDILPTLLEYLQIPYQRKANTGERPARETNLPGRSFAPLLQGKVGAETFADIYYEYEYLRCLREPRWKYTHRKPDGPHELYDLRHDPDEFQNLVNSPAHQETRERLLQKLTNYFEKHHDDEYDLWNGGCSQSRLLSELARDLPVSVETTQANASQQSTAVDRLTFDKSFQPVELQLPPGFVAELAAAPPLVQHPMMACFDGRGRLYVCENAGVNKTAAELEAELPNSIRRLEDIDSDGIYDRTVLFADKMTFPMGACWVDGALYVASPPHIWKLVDHDDDGVADERIPLVSKFGYTGNAASIHGCFAGPDGRIYWCDGFHGHQFANEKGEITSQRKGSYLFSCRTDGTDVRIHCGGGMDNPVEIDFSPAGELLGTVNIMMTRPRVDCFTHWQYGGAYPHRESVLEELKVTGDFLEPVHRFGHVAVSGTMRYRSGLLDPEWRDNYFTTFFNLGKVVRLELQEQGSSYQVEQREFLASANRDFHPTDVLEDADGSLLVIDTGGWFYRGCPTSQLSKPEISGGIYRIRRESMIEQLDPRGHQIDWEQSILPQLIHTLNDPRERVRAGAVDRLVKLGQEVVPELVRVLQSGDIRPRQEAVWALLRIGVENGNSKLSSDGLRLALNDRDQTIRRSACQALLTYPQPELLTVLIEKLGDTDRHVQRLAAAALGRLGDARAVPYLLQSLTNVADRNQEHAIIYALIEIHQPEATLAGLTNSSPRIQTGALIALSQMDQQLLTLPLLIAMLKSTDEKLQQRLIPILLKHAESAGTMESTESLTLLITELQTQCSAIEPTLSSENRIRLLVSLADNEPVKRLIGEILNDPTGDLEFRRDLIRELAVHNRTAFSSHWLPFVESEIRSRQPERIRPLLPFWNEIRGQENVRLINDLIRDEELPISLRIEMQLALQAGSSLSAESFQMICRGYEAAESVQTISEMTQLLSKYRLSDSQLIDLSGYLDLGGTSVLRQILSFYMHRNQPEVAAALLDGLERSRFVTNVPPTEISDIIKSYPQNLLPRANALLDQLLLAYQQKLQMVDDYLTLLPTGDPGQGRQLFLSEKSKCAACHRVGEQGVAVGPDLSQIGANRSGKDLLESILFPSATIVRDYETYTVVLASGQVINGLRTRETGQGVEIQLTDGKHQFIEKAEIEEMLPSELSLMPAGLEKNLSPAELADLIAYLLSLKTHAQQPGK